MREKLEKEMRKSRKRNEREIRKRVKRQRF